MGRSSSEEVMEADMLAEVGAEADEEGSTGAAASLVSELDVLNIRMNDLP